VERAPEPRASDDTLTSTPETTDAPERAGKQKSFWRELPVLVVIAFVVALIIKSFVVQAFFIPSASMEPTLMVGDRVLVEKVTYRVGGPSRGDVVVFERDFGGVPVPEEERSFVTEIGDAFRGLFGFPTGGAQDFIKRVIAVEGDDVEGRDGRLFVNGEEVTEQYLPEGAETSSFGPVKVPDGSIFVMGDNRGNSDDSRSFGPVPVDHVVGHAFVLIWPPSNFGGL
jgi:signal peptidase I